MTHLVNINSKQYFSMDVNQLMIHLQMTWRVYKVTFAAKEINVSFWVVVKDY
jgi:hypothetical protein